MKGKEKRIAVSPSWCNQLSRILEKTFADPLIPFFDNEIYVLIGKIMFKKFKSHF